MKNSKPVLEIIYRNSINGGEVVAHIFRQGDSFATDAAHDDIKEHIRFVLDQAPYDNRENDVDVLSAV